MKKYRQNQLDNAESLDEFLQHNHDKEMKEALSVVLRQCEHWTEIRI